MKHANHPHITPVAIRLGIATVVCLLLLAGVAQAAVTTTRITDVHITGQAASPNNAFFQNENTNPSQTITISGTSDGTTGDSVDIFCYQGSNSVGQLATNVAVSADGTFTTQIPESSIMPSTCELEAQPSGTGGTPDPSTFAGPSVSFSQFSTSTVGDGGQNTSDISNFNFQDATAAAQAYFGESGICTADSALVSGTDDSTSNYLWDCASVLSGSNNDYFGQPNDLTASEIQVDGHNAYGSFSASQLFTGSTNSRDLSGFPQATVHVDSFDAATGNAQVTDDEPLVACSSSDVYNPSSSDCASFVSTGVELDRTLTVSDAGKVQTVSDVFRSTDGAAHSIAVSYEDDLASTTAGWQLPGESGYTNHSTGQTAQGPSASGPGTVNVIGDPSSAASFANPVGEATFSTPYNKVTFDNTFWGGEDSALFEFDRTVPAGGSTMIAWSYGTAATAAEQQAQALAAQDSFAAPQVSITSPAQGAALDNVSTVTVSGTVTAGSGVKSVSVNGVAATVSGGSFSAQVPVSIGSDTLAATVTSVGGATATASVTVQDQAPVATTPAPTPTPTPPTAHPEAKPSVSFGGPSLRWSHGRLVLWPGVRVSCPQGESGCRARLTIKARVKLGRHERWVVLGREIVKVRAGRRVALELTLPRKSAALVEHLKSLHGNVSVAANAVGGPTVKKARNFTVKVHPPTEKHRR